MQETRARLLIVDDEAPIRMALSAILDEFGYSVRTADDGFSALAEMRREIPDVIVADLNMPRMSGFEFALGGASAISRDPGDRHERRVLRRRRAPRRCRRRFL